MCNRQCSVFAEQFVQRAVCAMCAVCVVFIVCAVSSVCSVRCAVESQRVECSSDVRVGRCEAGNDLPQAVFSLHNQPASSALQLHCTQPTAFCTLHTRESTLDILHTKLSTLDRVYYHVSSGLMIIHSAHQIINTGHKIIHSPRHTRDYTLHTRWYTLHTR